MSVDYCLSDLVRRVLEQPPRTTRYTDLLRLLPGKEMYECVSDLY